MMYKYGMRLRPFGIGCQPMDGYLYREPYEGFKCFKYSDKYWDVIVYNRELNEKEMEDYELDFVGVIK